MENHAKIKVERNDAANTHPQEDGITEIKVSCSETKAEYLRGEKSIRSNFSTYKGK